MSFDPKFLKKGKEEGKTIKELYDEIVKYYSDNIGYGASRLWEEFNVPPEYLHIF